MERSTVLITGASSGIGHELARVFAAHDHDLIITARREDRLEHLARHLAARVKVTVMPADLGKAKGATRLLARLADDGHRVDILVNNAGVMTTGAFQELGSADVRSLLQLNIRALTDLIFGVLPDMIERGHGRILNVSSVAGFQGLAGMALYSATKAYVLALTEGLAEDLRGTGVTATALCPGLTRTEMTRELDDRLALAGPLVARAEDVAVEGYRACMAGEAVRVPGLMNAAMVNWMRYQPRWLVRRLSGLFARTTLDR